MDLIKINISKKKSKKNKAILTNHMLTYININDEIFFVPK